ncbi:hypothetical protein D3C72_1135840 [compost metagenome]
MIGQPVHRHGPERIDGRQAAWRKAQRVRVPAIQLLAPAVFFQHGIQRLFAAVGADADLRTGRARQIVVLELGAAAEQPIGLAGQRRAVLVDVVLRRMHAFLQGAAQARVQLVYGIGLAGLDADAGKPFAQPFFRGMGGRKLQQKSQLVVELQRRAHLAGRHRGNPFNGGGRGRRGPLGKGRQGLDLVARLDALDVIQVGRIEQLRAAHHVDEFGFRLDHLGDAAGHLAVPARPRHQEVAAAVAGFAAADVGKIVGVQIHQLQDEVPPHFDGRHADHDGFRPQIQHGKRVRRVGVRRHESRVFRREHARNVVDRVERPLVLRVVLVDAERIHGLVAGDHGRAIQIRFAGDAARLLRGDAMNTHRLRPCGFIGRRETAPGQAGRQQGRGQQGFGQQARKTAAGHERKAGATLTIAHNLLQHLHVVGNALLAAASRSRTAIPQGILAYFPPMKKDRDTAAQRENIPRHGHRQQLSRPPLGR